MKGGYYAPELTKVVDSRGEAILRQSSNPLFPGHQMTDNGCLWHEPEDAEAMVAYFKWIGNIDLNGFDRVVSPLAKDNNNDN